MIRKQDLLDRAREWQLRVDVVEKDYVLGWVLASIAQHDEASASWVFKGGTCLKKCYFETYRFSEDLDFTLLPEAPYDVESLTLALREIVEAAGELSGVEFPADLVEVRQRQDKLGRPTFKGKVGYRGPLQSPGTPRLLFDLTRHEEVVDEPELRPVFHPYPDVLPEGTAVQSYGLEELLAEKTRALLERTRPRDLYDVVLLDGHARDMDVAEARAIFRRKCEGKGLAVPTSQELVSLVRSSADLRADWEQMLSHQLPLLPPFEEFLARAVGVLAWVDVPAEAPAPAQLQAVRGTEPTVAPAGTRFWGIGVPLEAVRFAGINRLAVQFTYHGKPRLAEPYSLRQSSTGKLLLYAWEGGQIKAFDVREIVGLSVTGTAFAPRFRVEFSATGALAAPPVQRPVGVRRSTRRTARTPRRRYLFRCPTCEKLFYHVGNDSSLRPHKAPDGWRCSSRRGTLERVD